MAGPLVRFSHQHPWHAEACGWHPSKAGGKVILRFPLLHPPGGGKQANNLLNGE
jgi:hypothetical protein